MIQITLTEIGNRFWVLHTDNNILCVYEPEQKKVHVDKRLKKEYEIQIEEVIIKHHLNKIVENN